MKYFSLFLYEGCVVQYTLVGLSDAEDGRGEISSAQTISCPSDTGHSILRV